MLHCLTPDTFAPNFYGRPHGDESSLPTSLVMLQIPPYTKTIANTTKSKSLPGKETFLDDGRRLTKNQQADLWTYAHILDKKGGNS
jgi:hypothetical protein